MTVKAELSAPKRRTRAEVQQLVAEFMSSGMRPAFIDSSGPADGFCEGAIGLSLSVLVHHLLQRR
jgi:hypothetical protein